MRIKALGTGSAFVYGKDNFQSNFFIETEDKTDNLLFDFGTSINDALEYHNISKNDIKKMYLSHNHADHNGGGECIGFSRYFGTFPFGQNIPELIGHHLVLEECWESSLKGGMKSIQGKTATLETYFNTNYLPDSGSFKVGDKINCDIIQTIHVMDNRRVMPSYGLMITSEDNKKIFITGDTQLSQTLNPFYDEADIIFQDCELANYPNSVHAQYHELCKLPEKIKNKMWLYHYNCKIDDLPNCTVDGFKGFIIRGQEFEI